MDRTGSASCMKMSFGIKSVAPSVSTISEGDTHYETEPV
jgi:hypothetical protein